MSSDPVVKFFIIALFICGIVIGIVIGVKMELAWGVNVKLVERGVKQYNLKTGELEWVEATK